MNRVVLNQVILTGRVATPPRRQYQPDGTPVIQFPLELNELGTEKGLVPIVAFGTLALSHRELEPGQLLLVKGKLRSRRWQTPQGRERRQIEIVASELQLVEPDSSLREKEIITERREG